MEFIIFMLSPLLCLLLLFKIKKCWLFSLITVLATMVLIAIEVVMAFTSSDFHIAAFAFQLFIPGQLIGLFLALAIGNPIIVSRNKREKEQSK
ncbi:MAG: hypothetical protein II740_02580 [Lachnospiraceae bacterium]|nr:hypothetical protein [Lachnospiraceae bacterium]